MNENIDILSRDAFAKQRKAAVTGLSKGKAAAQSVFVTLTVWLVAKCELSPERADYGEFVETLNMFACEHEAETRQIVRWLGLFTPLRFKMDRETGTYSATPMGADVDVEADFDIEGLAAQDWWTAKRPSTASKWTKRANIDEALARIVKRVAKDKIRGYNAATMEAAALAFATVLNEADAERKAEAKARREARKS